MLRRSKRGGILVVSIVCICGGAGEDVGEVQVRCKEETGKGCVSMGSL